MDAARGLVVTQELLKVAQEQEQRITELEGQMQRACEILAPLIKSKYPAVKLAIDPDRAAGQVMEAHKILCGEG